VFKFGIPNVASTLTGLKPIDYSEKRGKKVPESEVVLQYHPAGYAIR